MPNANRFLPVAVAIVLGLNVSAYADPINNAPPLGAILDLNGQSIPHGAPQQYTVDFNATNADTAITIAFRDDPDYISFSDPTLVDVSTAGGNILTDSLFNTGTYTSNGNTGTPNGWLYANQYGAAYGGFEGNSGNGVGGGNAWSDGAVQAYDALSQTVATTIGDTYRLSFYVTENSDQLSFSDLSTNGDTADTGGNGIDVLVYAQNGLPAAAVPEPMSMALLGVGLLSLVAVRRRRASTV